MNDHRSYVRNFYRFRSSQGKLATPLQTWEEGKHFEAKKSLKNFDLNTQDVSQQHSSRKSLSLDSCKR